MSRNPVFRGFIFQTSYLVRSIFVPLLESQQFRPFLDTIWNTAGSQPLNSKELFLLNKPREQFNIEQDQARENEDISPEYLLAQIDYYLKEHVLNQEVIIGEYIVFFNPKTGYWDLENPLQKSNGSFLKERLESIHNDIQPYLNLHGIVLTSEDIDFIEQNPELLGTLFPAPFFQTRAGLEVAEYIGLWRFAQLIGKSVTPRFEFNKTSGSGKLHTEQSVVLFSPYDTSRGTQRVYHWTNVAEVVGLDRDIKHVRVTYLKSDQQTDAYLRKSEILTGHAYQFTSSPERVAWPEMVNLSSQDIARMLGVRATKRTQRLFQDALEAHTQERLEIVNLLQTYPPVPTKVIEAKMIALGEIVIQTLNLEREKVEPTLTQKEIASLKFSQEGYFQGGTCGAAWEVAESESFLATGMMYGDPVRNRDRWVCKCCGAVHCITNGDPSTYYEKCVHCGASGRC